MKKQTKIILIVAAIIVAGAFIVGAIVYINREGTGKHITVTVDETKIFLSPQEAAEKAIKYINENLLSEGENASLIEVFEEFGFYKIHIKIGETEYNSYVTRDGRFLFPEVYNLEEKPKTAAEAQQTEIPKTEKPEVELFVMSFCPFGNQAEDIIKPVKDLLGSKINLTLRYIVSKDGDKYSSLHGDQELNQDVRELCVAKSQNDKFWSFVEAINKDCTAQNADTCWEKTASDLGINVQKIKDCQSTEASSLLDQEISAAEQYGVTGSPQLFINGVEYQGDRTSEAYKVGICSGFNTQPTECSQILSADTSTTAQGGCQ